jgi:hypothetical protein
MKASSTGPAWVIKLTAILRRSFPARAAQRFVDMQGLDLAFRVAAQLFISVIPLMIVASAISPVGGGKSLRETSFGS